MIGEKSQCVPLTDYERRQLSSRLRGAKQEKVTRFNRARRYTQIIVGLAACGPMSVRQLAKIIASYTGEDPEVVRRILHRHLPLLKNLWFVEKSEKTIRLTPLGLLVAKKVFIGYPDSELLAERLEELEPSLRGLTLVIRENHKQELDAINTNEIKIKLFSFREILYIKINHSVIDYFNTNNTLDLLKRFLVDVADFANKVIGKVFGEDENKVISYQEYRDAVKDHTTRVLNAIKRCASGLCQPEDEKLLDDIFWHESKFFKLIDKIDPEYIKRYTNWSEGYPSLRSRLALVLAEELLPGEVGSLIRSYAKNEDLISPFLLTLLTVYTLDRLENEIRELLSEIEALAEYKHTILPQLWTIRDKRYRELVSTLILLHDTLSKLGT